MKRKLFEQVPGEMPPEIPGNYITNLGTLVFDGKNFLVPGHKVRTPTTVEWWGKELEEEKIAELKNSL